MYDTQEFQFYRSGVYSCLKIGLLWSAWIPEGYDLEQDEALIRECFDKGRPFGEPAQVMADRLRAAGAKFYERVKPKRGRPKKVKPVPKNAVAFVGSVSFEDDELPF